MRWRSRTGQAEIIATLILIAAAVLFTTLILFWGLALQGQGTQNFGNALARTNAQAAEQISIDNVLFTKVSSSPNTYALTVYVRNFGDTPFQLAGIDINILASGISPGSYHCEVSSSGTPIAHAVIVARSMLPVNLNLASGLSSTAPGCVTTNPPTSVSPITFSSTWDGQTISVQVSTAGGTQYANNYAVPS